MRRKLVDIPCIAALCNAGKSKHVLSKLYSGGVYLKGNVLALYKNHSINLNQFLQVNFPHQLFQNDKTGNPFLANFNLNTQKRSTDNDKLVAKDDISVSPKPFTNNFFIDYCNIPEEKSINTMVTGSTGKTVSLENWLNTHYISKKRVALNTVEPGIYLVNMIMGNNSKRITKKIIKY